MTILFRQKNMTMDDSITLSFVNLKEKLEEYQKEKLK